MSFEKAALLIVNGAKSVIGEFLKIRAVFTRVRRVPN